MTTRTKPVVVPADLPRFISIAQFAAATGLNMYTVRREIKRGNIQTKRLSARRIGIPTTELSK
jgi:IS30 family transposase